MSQLSDYIQKTYGQCTLNECRCLKCSDVLRLLCSNWVPTTAKTWEELLEIQKRKRQNDKQSN